MSGRVGWRFRSEVVSVADSKKTVPGTSVSAVLKIPRGPYIVGEVWRGVTESDGDGSYTHRTRSGLSQKSVPTHPLRDSYAWGMPPPFPDFRVLASELRTHATERRLWVGTTPTRKNQMISRTIPNKVQDLRRCNDDLPAAFLLVRQPGLILKSLRQMHVADVARQCVLMLTKGILEAIFFIGSLQGRQTLQYCHVALPG